MSKKSIPIIDPKNSAPAQVSSASEIDLFLANARSLTSRNDAGGRLIFALDATMSRQPTWDMACDIQSHMFSAVEGAGNLQVQLAYYRGASESAASKFVANSGALRRLMTTIDCRGGYTQIRKILAHTLREHAKKKVDALIFIGDAVEEDGDQLADLAGKLGLNGVPVFIFQENHDRNAEAVFRELARLSRGAWFRFDKHSAERLAKLLASIALYASSGIKALEARGQAEDILMIQQLRGE